MMQKSEFQELYLHLSFTKACDAILIELIRLQQGICRRQDLKIEGIGVMTYYL